jgi:membrane protease YdiL (CAAX protease family)
MPSKSEKNKVSEEVTAYALLAFAFSSIFYYLVVRGYTSGLSEGNSTLFLMWCPALAAIVTSLVYRRSIRGFGWGPGEPKYLLVGYLLPIAYLAITYVPAWLLGLGAMEGGVSIDPFMLVIIGTISAVIAAAGEEIGWRGFFVPKLLESNGDFTKTVIYSGIIWSVWHFPVILFGGTGTGAPPVWDIASFTIQATSIGVVLAWLRLKSGSLWPCVLLHAANTLYGDSFFGALTANSGITKYVVGQAGVLTCLVYIAFALYFWSRRKEVEGKKAPAKRK